MGQNSAILIQGLRLTKRAVQAPGFGIIAYFDVQGGAGKPPTELLWSTPGTDCLQVSTWSHRCDIILYPNRILASHLFSMRPSTLQGRPLQEQITQRSDKTPLQRSPSHVQHSTL